MPPLLDKTAAIHTLDPDDSDADKEGYVANSNLANVKINIQPATPEYVAMTGGEIGKTWLAWLDTTASGIKIKDRVVVSGTATYSGHIYEVEGVQEWQHTGPDPHIHISLSEIENAD